MDATDTVELTDAHTKLLQTDMFQTDTRTLGRASTERAAEQEQDQARSDGWLLEWQRQQEWQRQWQQELERQQWEQVDFKPCTLYPVPCTLNPKS
jgi:arylamine N-acetyltransferase